MSDRQLVAHRRLPEPCPYCAKTLDADSGLTTTAAPKPGDVGICWGCLRPLVFDENRHRRKPTLVEAIEISGDPTVQSAIARARKARR